MIRLGDSPFWIDPGASGWMLLRVGTKKHPGGRWGPFTSPKHVLQQRQVDLPKEARRELKALVQASEEGDELVREAPPAS